MAFRLALGEIVLVAFALDILALRWFGVSAVAALAFGQLLLLYWYFKHIYGIFERLGIPYVPPKLVVGNVIDMKWRLHEQDIEHMAKYGKVYGTFLAATPNLVVSDLDMLKQIFVKDFRDFTNRRAWDFPEGSIFSRMITLLKDDDWKSLRNTITPAFTAGKMQKMTPLVLRNIENLLNSLSEIAAKADSFDAQKHFGALTMDVISSCAFATDVNSVQDPDNELVRHSRDAFDVDFYSPMFILIYYFPNVIFRFLPKLRLGPLYYLEVFFTNLLTKMLKERREHPTMVPDFLQLLINAHKDRDHDAAETAGNSFDDEVTKSGAGDSWGSLKRKLSDLEIMAQSFVFLAAGYHTTATTLTFCAYNLATNLEAQQRCYDELKAALTKEPQKEDAANVITVDLIRSHLPYLEAVILETLRLYSPATRTERVCGRDCEINGFQMKKGMIISVPVHAIHHSVEYYFDPEKFDPERFLPEERAKRDPLTFLPFGFGPRNCVGMRFAMLELKLALANILVKFKLKPCDKTEVDRTVGAVTVLRKCLNC